MMRRDTYNNIVKAARLLSLVVLMAFGAGLKGWGQKDLPDRQNQYHTYLDFCYNRPENNIVRNNNDQPGFSEVDEILYVMPGDKVEIALQYYDVTENLNGYVRWYLEGDHKGDGTTLYLSRETSGNLGLVQYKNGYAWFRYNSSNYAYTNLSISGNNYVTPSQICYITYTCPENYQDSDQHVVVCEASSLTNFGDPITNLNNTKDTRMAPTLSIRKRYIIKSAVTMRNQLNKYRMNITEIKDNLGSNWLAVDDKGNNNNTELPLDIISNPSKYFKEVYTIHTPIRNDGQGTTYRLNEAMSSYYVPNHNSPVTQVRWRTYDVNRKYLYTETKNVPQNNHAEVESGWANLFNHKFDLNGNLSVTHTRYITAEVRNSNGDWYPVSFQKILLEPNIVPMTQKELEQDNTYASERRLLSSLSDPNRYEQLGQTISFDESVVSFNNLKNGSEKNVAELPYSEDTYYAFAFPSRWENRGGYTPTTGRGEYGLYRTLNYPGVSTTQQHYKDYFAANGYNVWVADRTYDLTEGVSIGHFFYVDAADEPGVIASIDLDNVTLCPSTSLIVTAWVCNLLHKSGSPDGADIGITFIGISKDGTETILDKYYSGELSRKPSDGDENIQAQWQQIYFNFTTDVEYPSYRVEISNNSPSSNGADYAVDDIRIYRSLPDISVARLDACESSQLYVSSDYQTILNNMGWYLDADVLGITPGIDIDNDFDARKYRYGFLTNEIILNPEKVGNVYFGVLDGEKFDDKQIEWISVNNLLKGDPEVGRLAYVIRSVVPTNLSYERFPDDKERAQAMEIEINIQAMRDYNSDIDNGKFREYIHEPISLDELEDIKFGNGEKVLYNPELLRQYEEKVHKLYTILQIPRIHVPWKGKDKNGMVTDIYLAQIDVDNTDMKYMDELDPNGGEAATGYYKVYLFSAAQIVNGVGVDAGDKCALVSSFWVYPSIVIKVDTETAQNDVLCQNSIHTIKAQLVTPILENGYPTGAVEELEDVEYNFDWYLNTKEDYDKIEGDDGRDLKAIITAFRELPSNDESIKSGGPFTADDVANSSLSPLEKDILIGLLSAPTKLISGKEIEFQLTGQIVAIPYVYNGDVDVTHRLYCTNLQAVDLETNPNIPELAPGFPNVDYSIVKLTNIPLRLGLPNIKNGNTLVDIPIQKQIVYGVKDATDNVLKPLPYNKNILLDVGGHYQEIATLNELVAQNGVPSNKMTMTFNNGAEQFFKEGHEYDLLVPFGEYENESAPDVIEGSCEGYAHLFIKIVPEYLTWQGDGSGVWYNDESSWTISTKDELYNKDDVTNETEDVYSFSPLYFTKITIPDGMELPLYDEASQNSIQNNQPLNFSSMEITSGTTSNIEYDMAVYSVDGGNSVSVKPYYGNLVSEIYFKPKALLKNQQYLNYEKAWVEFEMEKGKKYWLSSPLKDVFAGDMYAPTGTGRQTTPAFTDITYIHGTQYNRWDPAFYQKAWDKGITYYTNTVGTTSETVSAVQSNWSIEYNDVNVPYSLGKGFYASVEGDFTGDSKNGIALVRLPKADKSYLYYGTRVADVSSIEDRQYAGKLADGNDITITLSDDEAVDVNSDPDGDGTHFLLGNPYMYPLDMTKFFDGNKDASNNDIFNRKYWILSEDAASVVVGTPDVEWGNGVTSGQIPLMTAFFVELAKPLDESTSSVDIKFTTSMMADAVETRSVDTKSLTASNPILTLTAERGETRSVARLLTSDKGHDAYEASEDAVILLDSELDAPMVYTVAGDVAAQFNTMQSIKNVPLGVYADKGEEVELTIRGISQFAEKLYLYDAVTKQSTPLDDDSYTFRVTGPSHGRFTLTSQNRISAESDICVYSPTPGQLLVMSAPEEPLQRVQVYDMSGRMVTSRDNIRNTTCQLTVPSGIYVVYAENETGNVRVKVRVR